MSNTTLPDNAIVAMAIDAADRKWFATRAGIGMLAGAVWTAYTTDNYPILDSYVSAIAFDGSGNEWVGSLASGLARQISGSWTYFNTSISSIPDDYIYCITHSGTSVWVGTDSGAGTTTDTAWTTYTTANGLPSNHVGALLSDAAGTMWAGTDKGLARKTGATWAWSPLRRQRSSTMR